MKEDESCDLKGPCVWTPVGAAKVCRIDTTHLAWIIGRNI